MFIVMIREKMFLNKNFFQAFSRLNLYWISKFFFQTNWSRSTTVLRHYFKSVHVFFNYECTCIFQLLAPIIIEYKKHYTRTYVCINRIKLNFKISSGYILPYEHYKLCNNIQTQINFKCLIQQNKETYSWICRNYYIWSFLNKFYK